MFNGPGKYDDLCTQAREAAGALGAVLIILDGEKGHGFEVQATLPMVLSLPKLLRDLADAVEAQQRAAAFTCPNCKRVSYHPEDKANGYCGACHEFTGAVP